MVCLSEVIGWTARDEGSAPCSVADSMHDLTSAVMHTRSSTHTDNLPVQLQAMHEFQGTLKGTSRCCCCPNHEEQAWLQDLSLQMDSLKFSQTNEDFSLWGLLSWNKFLPLEGVQHIKEWVELFGFFCMWIVLYELVLTPHEATQTWQTCSLSAMPMIMKEELLIETKRFSKMLIPSKDLYLAFTELGREVVLSSIPATAVEVDVNVYVNPIAMGLTHCIGQVFQSQKLSCWKGSLNFCPVFSSTAKIC